MESGNVRIKLPSNDSFDEDTLSDDVDDEVFIKSARNGFRNSNKDKTLQKPLMAPRKKSDKEKVRFTLSAFEHVVLSSVNTNMFFF